MSEHKIMELCHLYSTSVSIVSFYLINPSFIRGRRKANQELGIFTQGEDSEAKLRLSSPSPNRGTPQEEWFSPALLQWPGESSLWMTP